MLLLTLKSKTIYSLNNTTIKHNKKQLVIKRYYTIALMVDNKTTTYKGRYIIKLAE